MKNSLKQEALKKVNTNSIGRLGLDEKKLAASVEMAESVTREVVEEHLGTGAHHLRILFSRAANTNKATALQLVMDHRFSERAKKQLGLDGYQAAALKNAVMPAYAKAMTLQVQGRTHVLEDMVSATN
jgi:hypothetical protein